MDLSSKAVLSAIKKMTNVGKLFLLEAFPYKVVGEISPPPDKGPATPFHCLIILEQLPRYVGK